jgi:outer membrane usher protein
MTLSFSGWRPPCRLRLAQWFIIGSSGMVLGKSEAILATEILEFQSGFMRQNSAHSADAGALSLKALANEHSLAPGRYRVEVSVNQAFLEEREIEFMSSPDGAQLVPCLSQALLEQAGLRIDRLEELNGLQMGCIDLIRLVPGSHVEFDGGQMKLALSIPHIAMRRDSIGYVDPIRWDAGINAAFFNYQVSAQQGSSRRRGSTHSDDLQLNSGINLGGWRLRSNQSLRQTSDGDLEWVRAYTYAQRDVPGTRANLTLGETFTPGDVFRSLPIKGMVIATDLGMLPDSLQGYAPVIRGVAQSRAKLEVLQNGYPIYSTYVSAGPYEIDDLSTAGGSGELEVVLTEDDGQVRRFTQPYASLGNLLREGVWRYSASLGRYNPASNLQDPLLWQGTLAMGGMWDSTFYGGVLASDFYRASNLGIAKDLGRIGALGFDVTRSSADIDNLTARRVDGMSYAIKYGKSFQTNTSLRFAGYRYSTEGYRDFDEAVRERRRESTFRGGRRSRLEAAVMQNLGDASSINLTWSQEDFWSSDYQQRQFQFNVNTQYKGITYSLFASQPLSEGGLGDDRQMGLSLSFPLDFGHSNRATLDFRENGGRYNQAARLTGSTDQNRLNYSASLSSDENRQQSTSLSLGYQASVASVGVGITQGSDSRNLSLNASGAVLLHADGVELGSYMGDTSALVHVPGIAGVGVMNATGARTNEKGYALVPSLRPYRVNSVVLQTDQLGPEIEIDNGSAQVVPRRGAVVKTTFAARSVSRLVITGQSPDGRPLPFGAQVSDATGAVLSIVGQAGQMLLSTHAEPQTLTVRWGELAEHQCQLRVIPASMDLKQGYRLQTLMCLRA